MNWKPNKRVVGYGLIAVVGYVGGYWMPEQVAMGLADSLIGLF